MKLFKIFLLIFAFAIVGTVAISQTVMKPSQSILVYNGVATDTLKSSAAGEWTHAVYPNKDMALKLDMQIKLLRSVTTITPPKCTIYVEGKKFDTDASWSNITSMSLVVPATGGGLKADSVITRSETSTAQYYRYFRVRVAGTVVAGNPEMGIGFVKWKFYK